MEEVHRARYVGRVPICEKSTFSYLSLPLRSRLLSPCVHQPRSSLSPVLWGFAEASFHGGMIHYITGHW